MYAVDIPFSNIGRDCNLIKNKYQNEHKCTHPDNTERRADACNVQLLSAAAPAAFQPVRSSFRPHPPRVLWHMFGHSGVMLICILNTDYNMNTRIAITMINRLWPIGKCSGLMTKDSNWRQPKLPKSPVSATPYSCVGSRIRYEIQSAKQLKVPSWQHG